VASALLKISAKDEVGENGGEEKLALTFIENSHCLPSLSVQTNFFSSGCGIVAALNEELL
jgi:hypothetical protein